MISIATILINLMIDIEVKPRSKSLKPVSLSESPDARVEKVVADLANRYNCSIHRLRVTVIDDKTKKHVPLDQSKTLVANGVTGKSVTIYVKDLGPQISWRTVFVIEYLGPLLIHPIVWVGYEYLYPGISRTLVQTLAFYMVQFHFFKREFETLFVHKFLNATMPVFNIFKNSAHYWVLSGVNLSVFIYGPQVHATKLGNFAYHVLNHSAPVIGILVGVWFFAEISNFVTHIILAQLRVNDTKRYVIPYGYGFNWVSCPNYFFESLAWFAYALLVGNWSAWLFFVVATGQMWVWAVKKHQRYLKTFGDEYKKLRRKIYVPGIL